VRLPTTGIGYPHALHLFPLSSFHACTSQPNLLMTILSQLGQKVLSRSCPGKFAR